jgi:hypothetical protein
LNVVVSPPNSTSSSHSSAHLTASPVSGDVGSLLDRLGVVLDLRWHLEAMSADEFGACLFYDVRAGQV